MPTNNELEKVEMLYEVLLRFEGDRVTGAHQQNLVCVYDGEQLLSTSLGKLMSIDPTSETMKEVLGEALAVALADNTRILAKTNVLKERIKVLEAQVKRLKG